MNRTTDALADARRVVLAEINRDRTPDFRRLADRLSAMLAEAIDACAGPDDLLEEAEALRRAQSRAGLLRDLAQALSAVHECYRSAQQAPIELP